MHQTEPIRRADQIAVMDEAARQCRASLLFFTRMFWDTVEPGRPFVDGWHIHALAEHLEAVFRRQIRELAIAMPPRHMKSTLVSVMFHPWIWAQDPQHRFIFGSYDQQLSTRDAVKSRRIIESPLYRALFGHQVLMSSDQNQKTRYENDRAGYRIATSVGGGGTGEGGDIVVGDDLMNARKADNERTLEEAHDFWFNAMRTRWVNPSTFCRIVVAQRLNERDPIGESIRRGVTLLKLPARYVGEKLKTPLGWQDPRERLDELLWPNMFNEQQLRELSKDMTARQIAGQFQQEPAPLEGEIFKRAWWRWYDQAPTGFDTVLTSWDLTFDEGEKTDFVVGQCWGRKGADKFLLDQVRARMGFTEQVRSFQTFAARWPQATAHLVEKKANGAALIDTLRSKVTGIIPVVPTTSKLNRAEAVSPQMEAGNVHLPKNAPWVGDYVEEHAKFPGGRNDDQVDATSQALARLNKNQWGNFSAVSLTKESVWR